MPTVKTLMGDVLVYDGTNAAEIAAACKVDPAPTPAEDGSITLLVPFPTGGANEATLQVGDGLTKRPPLGFLPMTAEQVAMFTGPPEDAVQPTGEPA